MTDLPPRSIIRGTGSLGSEGFTICILGSLLLLIDHFCWLTGAGARDGIADQPPGGSGHLH